MDAHTREPLTVVSFCSGVGMLDLGVRLGVSRARTVCYVENDRSCVDVLCARMREDNLDCAPIWDDLKTFDGAEWCGVVDLVVAGFPCQYFSTATRGRPTAENLWPSCAERIAEIRPRFVFLENVAKRAIEGARVDLEFAGFRCAVDRFDAASLGAPHRRPRWFLLADADAEGEPPCPLDGEVARLQEAPVLGPWATEPSLSLGVDDGTSDRMVRLAALGNGVVPVVAAWALRTLAERLGVGALMRGDG